MATELSIDESAELERCEAVVERGLQTFFEVGRALLRIREGVGNGPLYRRTHTCFESYLKDRWSLGRSRAYQLMSATRIAERIKDHLSTRVDTLVEALPECEKQLRPLVRLEPEAQIQAWEVAVERAGGVPTTTTVEVVVAELYPRVSAWGDQDTDDISPDDIHGGPYGSAWLKGGSVEADVEEILRHFPRAYATDLVLTLARRLGCVAVDFGWPNPTNTRKEDCGAELEGDD